MIVIRTLTSLLSKYMLEITIKGKSSQDNLHETIRRM